MSANVVRVNSDYKIQTNVGGTITLDTGSSSGTVSIVGNLNVLGTTSTITTTNTNILDNLIVLNKGETGSYVGEGIAGIEIDRGPNSTYGNAQIVWIDSEVGTDPYWESPNGLQKSGVFVFRTKNGGLNGIRTNSIDTAGQSLVLIGRGTGVLTVAGTQDYELNVYDDDHIPNKRYLDLRLDTFGPRRIVQGDTSVIASDDSISGGLSKIQVLVNNVEIGTIKETEFDLYNLRFSNTTIENTASNNDIRIAVNGTGMLILDATNVQANGDVNILSSTASTTTTSGALKVAGGVGIVGAVYAGSIQATPIGSSTASTGAFTTVGATTANLTTANITTDNVTTLNATTSNLGTVSTGTWNATVVGTSYGGTGQSAYTDGQILIGKTSTGSLVKTTLTAGYGTIITNGSGQITIDSFGLGGTVTGVTAGTGLTVIDDTDGVITVSGVIAIANTGVSSGSYGSASYASRFTVNAQGQLTSASETAIAVDAAAITSGILSPARGGSGYGTYSDGDLLIGSSLGSTLLRAKLTQGTNIVISNGGGTITIDHTDKVTNLKGGNGTTLLGSIPYQSATDTTTLLSPNTTSTKKFLRQTGDGTNGAAPAWDTVVAGDLPSTLSPTTVLVGTQANTTRFPSAQVAISTVSAGIQQNETATNIGIIAEAVGSGSNYGVGVYGVGYTSAALRGTGVTGEAHVSATGDTASAIAVRGYSNDTHSGGLNISLFADASGSATGNYALYINAGNIYSGSALTWYLNGDLTLNGSYNLVVPTIVSTAATATTSSTAASVGFLGLPQLRTPVGGNEAGITNRTTLISDIGKHIYATETDTRVYIDGTLSYPIGSTITVIAAPGAIPVTIAVLVETLYWSPGGTTGTRTLAPYGIATVIKVDTGKWFISGTGIT
jgi:hypothetical protein